MAAYEGQSGSKDRGDPEVFEGNVSRRLCSVFAHLQTSNVFVANLPPSVTEQSLGMFFARIGPVGSVGLSQTSSPLAILSFFLGQDYVAAR